MVILDTLAHQEGTVVCIQRESLTSSDGVPGLRLVEIQQRLESVGPFAVWSAVHLHLEQAQIDPHLNLFRTILGGEDADLDPLGVKVPAGQDWPNILAHGCAVRHPSWLTSARSSTIRLESQHDTTT